MDLTRDYFSNFNLPRRYDVDMSLLADIYHQLHKLYHPDRFVTRTAVHKRRAVQVASYINQAYHVLRSPLYRAVYLLELQGMKPLEPSNTKMPVDFLLQQMQWRERMEVLPKTMNMHIALKKIAEEIRTMHKHLQSVFAVDYGAEQLQSAELTVRKLQFIDKLKQECNDLESRLLD